jgi:acetolactate synthase-1/2/3 large subunit
MKASDYIADFLHAQRVENVFEVIGGMITHLIDSLDGRGKIKIVSVHHEQAAAFAADAMGRLRGIPGVAMATSGPGATNLLTGIGSCYFDSSPALFITGQVNTYEQKGKRPVRQLGFQETDIVSMATPITKAAIRVTAPEHLPHMLEQAFRKTLSGRPGPVLVDIPMDVQRADIRAARPTPMRLEKRRSPSLRKIEEVLASLNNSKKPLILAGGGVHSSRSAQLLRRFIEVSGTPLVNSLMAVDALPFDHPLRIGMIGSYGNRWANWAIGKADFLLVIGSRLDIRQTGADTESFRKGRLIYHVDCDRAEVNNRVTGCRVVNADIHDFLRAAMKWRKGFPSRQNWLREINAMKAQWPDTAELHGIKGINPNAFMHQLSAASKRASVYVTDVGQHQMWAAQSLRLHPGQQFMTSGGMGAMGFGLPAAVGTAFACPHKPHVLIAGDGGFQLNIQELETVVHHKLPIKLVILHNKCYGMVRQFQESYFKSVYRSTYWGYSAPDFVRIAKAYGIDAANVYRPSDIDRALQKMWDHPLRPFLLEVTIGEFVNTFPKIAFGRPMTEMEPLAKPVEMEGT